MSRKRDENFVTALDALSCILDLRFYDAESLDGRSKRKAKSFCKARMKNFASAVPL